MDDPSIPPEGTTLIEPGFARGPARLTRRNGKLYLFRTCYEWVGWKWEGFVSMEAAGGEVRTA
jgi:hypothetical protein